MIRFRNNGFTLIELLITVVVIGLLASLAVPSFVNSLRRERINAVAASLAGWLDAVSVRPDQLGTTCAVTIRTGTLARGAVLATVAPSNCSTEPSLNLPIISQVDSVNVAATSSSFFFTPRGAMTTSATASNANTSVTMRISLAGAAPLRCVRLTGALANIEIGANPSTGNTAIDCSQWSRI
jgi:prepilin-type N-terminal cleavage/methylation domain-containing protein